MSTRAYLYSYILFAAVYALAGIFILIRDLALSRRLRHATDTPDAPVVGHEHTLRMADHTLRATLLPLLYVVCSLFLGSLILRNRATAQHANTLWALVTVVATLAVLVLVLRTPRRHAPPELLAEARPAASDSATTLHAGTRLRLSTALLALVVTFVVLNTWVVLGQFQQLLQTKYVL